MVKQLVLEGLNMGSEMLDRSLRYAQTMMVSADIPIRKFKHIHPELATTMLIDAQTQTIRVLEDFCLLYATVMEKTWLQYLCDGYLLFIPVCFPADDHWIVVVLWMNDANQFLVRVYNSFKDYRIHDKILALAAAQVVETMSQHNVQWHFSPCEDLLDQKNNAHRCGVHSVARAVQCMVKQMHMKLNITAVSRVGDFLASAALVHDKILVEDIDVSPQLITLMV